MMNIFKLSGVVPRSAANRLETRSLAVGVFLGHLIVCCVAAGAQSFGYVLTARDTRLRLRLRF
jgi:hypothetical protein